MSLDNSHAKRSAALEDLASRKLSLISLHRAQRLWERHALLTAAAHLFALHGFAATTLRAVAAAAGCSERAVRREFGGKAGLVASVIQDRTQVAWTDELEGGDSGSVGEEIVRIVESEAARIRGDREILGLMMCQEESGTLAEQMVQLSLASSAQRIQQRLNRFDAVTSGERQVLLCAIQAVAYALSFDRSEDTRPPGADSKVREFANILAERIECAGPAPSQSGLRLI